MCVYVCRAGITCLMEARGKVISVKASLVEIYRAIAAGGARDPRGFLVIPHGLTRNRESGGVIEYDRARGEYHASRRCSGRNRSNLFLLQLVTCGNCESNRAPRAAARKHLRQTFHGHGSALTLTKRVRRGSPALSAQAAAGSGTERHPSTKGRKGSKRRRRRGRRR